MNGAPKSGELIEVASADRKQRAMFAVMELPASVMSLSPHEREKAVAAAVADAGARLREQLGITTLCACPVLPDFSTIDQAELDRIVGSPLKCQECGSEIELRCPEGHVHKVEPTRSPNAKPRGADSKPRHYKPKPCATCRREFNPTGPRDNFCKRDDCHA